MSVKRPFFFVIAAVIMSCESSRGTQIVSTTDVCMGAALPRESELVRDAALTAILPKLLVPVNQTVLFVRTSPVLVDIDPVLIEPLASVVGAERAEALLAANRRASCWSGSFGATVHVALPVANVDFWPFFKENNPALAGVVVAGAPLFTDTATPADAYVILDYRCGQQCGSMWLVIAGNDGQHWKARKIHQLLQY